MNYSYNVGFSATTGTIFLVWFILELVTAWKVFVKYGEPGWKGLVPFYSDFVEFGKVWSPAMGLVYVVCDVFKFVNSYAELSGAIGAICTCAEIVGLIIGIIFAAKKSKAFGHKFGMTLVLIFFPFIGNLVLGFGKSEYKGK